MADSLNLEGMSSNHMRMYVCMDVQIDDTQTHTHMDRDKCVYKC